MKKSLVLSVILSVVILNVAMAATTVFDDLPRDHWAYKAIEQLVPEARGIYKNENMVVEKHLLSRYEFAVAIARLLVVGPNDSSISIPDSKFTEDQLANLKRLVDEFNDELGALGVDTDAVKRDLRDVKPIMDAKPGRPELREVPKERWGVLTLKPFGNVATAKPAHPVDVPSDHWAYPAGEKLGIAGGPTDGWHTDKRIMSRYQFAVEIARKALAVTALDSPKTEITEEQSSILIRLVEEFRGELEFAKLDTDAMVRNLRNVMAVKHGLRDVPKDHWAYESVKKLYELGIFQGYPQER